MNPLSDTVAALLVRAVGDVAAGPDVVVNSGPPADLCPAAIAVAVAAAATREEAMRALLDAVIAASGARAAVIHLFQRGLTVCRATFAPPGGVQWQDQPAPPPRGSATEEVLRSGRLVRVPDTRAREPLHPLLRALMIGSRIDVPVFLTGEVIGTLCAGWAERGRCSAERTAALVRLADGLGPPLADLRRRVEAERRLREQAIVTETAGAIAGAADLETALRALLAGMRELTGATAGGVRIPVDADEVFGQQRLFFWQGGEQYVWREIPTVPNTNTAQVLQTGRGRCTSDLTALAAAGDRSATIAIRDGVQSSLIVPLRAGGRLIGTLHADSRQTHAFSDELLVPLQVLADHAGGAVAQARLRDEAAQRLCRLEVAERVSAAVNAAGDLDTLLARVLAEAATLVGAEAGMVALVDDDRASVRGRVGLNLPLGLVEATVRPLFAVSRPGEDMYAIVVRSGEQVVFGGDHPALHQATTDQFGLRNWHRILTPIRHAEEVIGVLSVAWSADAVPSGGDLAMLRLVAEQAGGAIARARLVAQRQHMATQFAGTLAAVGGAGSAEAALDALLRGALALLRGESGVARMFDLRSGEGILLLEVEPDGVLSRNAERRALPPGSFAAALQAGGNGSLVEDFWTRDPRIPTLREVIKRQGMRSAVNVPIDAGGRRIGSLHINHRRPGHYTPADLALAGALAAQAGAAIERAQQYQEAEAARGETRAILDATSEAMVLLAPDGRIRSINRRFEEFFELDRESALRLVPEDVRPILARVFGDARAIQAPGGRAAAPESEFTLEVRQQWPAPRDLQLRATPVHGADGAFMGRLFAFRDVTREREVDRMKSEFVSLVSHELRTPLTSIKGYIDLLVAGEVGDLSADQIEFLGIAKSNADRLVDLTNDLLDISRIEAGKVDLKLVSLPLTPLLEQVARSFRPQFEARRQTLALHVAADLPPVLGDRDRLTQVFTNLVSNAHKYTPAGGSVAVSMAAEGEAVRIEVRDDGIGMSSEELERLFSRFYRARNRTTQEVSGTGLGLAITRSLVELHGGRIEVQSAPGQGSVFSVRLPAA